jgi:hypothetical protein
MKNNSFIEIYDTGAGIYNLRFLVKITRVTIRYLTRLLGYKKSLLILKFFQSILKFSNKSYFYYLLGLNIASIEYRISLYTRGVENSVVDKCNWSEYVLKESSNYKARLNARMYLSLLSRHGFYESRIKRLDKVFNQQLVQKHSKKSFYIYGPNSKNPPNPKYKDYTLVLLKDIKLINDFQKKLLFVNGIYYKKIIAEDSKKQSFLHNKYNRIVVSCLHSKLPSGFERAKFPMGCNISSPMALGRVLYNLMYHYGRFTCVIEGFDFYLNDDMYASYYPSLARTNGLINEQLICNSLSVHDALYNFLYVKEFCMNLEIKDSSTFIKLIEMNGKKYLENLDNVRNFKILRQS